MNLQKLKSQEYLYDQTILKIYGSGENRKIKLIRMNVLKASGIEIDDRRTERGSVNISKLDESILRSKSKIFELAYCNEWDWFFTGTLNPNKQDRTDLELYHKQLCQWIRDYNKRYHLSIKFLLIPEKHKDGKSWHMHGFLQGLPSEHLKQFQVGDIMGKALAVKVLKGDIVYNWEPYQNRFGFCDLEPIRNAEAVSKYITKYINKELANSVTELNAHTYYHSRRIKVFRTKRKRFYGLAFHKTYI
uniref:Replication-associated protein ORF2/G2P domain-containing protein n=1 Tax=uncultured prokaryote TaxID=198431 RepID=A0A0H5Q2W6_9ZZZZ|nr:hypothetical protein [uncultured prokaryote]